jgi:acyl-homoserine lactone acylase PvdQ
VIRKRKHTEIKVALVFLILFFQYYGVRGSGWDGAFKAIPDFTLHSLLGTENGQRKAEYGKIELLRDNWGVPHIYSNTDAGAMYGLGYATAEDRAFQMYYNLRIIQGRLAELIGDQKIGVTRQQPEGENSALRNDIKMRTIGYYHTAEKLADSLDNETIGLLQAYSDGVNDYIRNHPNDLLYLFGKLGLRPEPWTPAMCIASWWRLGLFFAGDGLNDMIAYYDIKEGKRKIVTLDVTDVNSFLSDSKIRDDASVIQREDVSDDWVNRVIDYAKTHGLSRKIEIATAPEQSAGRRFSHAWVAGAEKMEDGSAALVSDPQTPVRNPSLLYEFHISGSTFNARGIGVAGSPIILIGFTQNVAWGMTALGADQADLFTLKTDANHVGQYLYDGKWLNMQIRNETIKVKNGREQAITIKETHLGPVVTSLAAGLRRGDEVSLKCIPICESDRDTFEGALAMMRAKDVNEFQQALGGWRFPSANCLFGDREGNIGYMTILALPVRSSQALFDGLAAHDGWNSEMDWQEILPHELLPQVINPAQGWLVSANHRPIASFYPISLGNSTGSLGDTDRSWRLKERIKSKEVFKPEDVLDIHYDTVSSVKRDIVRLGYHLRNVQKFSLEEETLLALQYLETWRDSGSKLEMDIKGTEILNIMPLTFRQNFAASSVYGGGLSGLCNMLQTIDDRLDANPRASLTRGEFEFINLTLQAAWRNGKAYYGDDPNQWQRQARKKLIETELGYFTTLDGFGSLDEEKDIAVPALTCIDGGTIFSQRAQSYTQYVPLSNADNSMALLPIGQSEHPDSPYRLSGYELWAQGKLRPAPLSRRKVEEFVVSQKNL